MYAVSAVCELVFSVCAHSGVCLGADPDTSFGEDYGFAERALDAGFRHTCLDNTDGSFVYVRHHNTWILDAPLQRTLFDHMRALSRPPWMSDADFGFFRDEAASLHAPPAAASPVNYAL